MKYKALLFDLDGTLTDTLEDLKNSVNYALSQFDFPERNKDEICSFVGNGVQKLVFRSVPENTPENISLECLEIFKKHYDENCKVFTKPYDGTKELLTYLKSMGVKTAVITNKIDSTAREVVKYYFGELIDVIIGQSDNIKKKPAPDGVYEAMRKLGVAENEVIYIGDSDVDVETAKNAGIPCIAVLWGFRERELLEKHGATVFARTPNDIAELIGLKCTNGLMPTEAGN